jgi:hypothetical protein
VTPGRLSLLRILGYLGAAVLLGLGASVGGGAGTLLLVFGLVVIAGLLLTFRLR